MAAKGRKKRGADRPAGLQRLGLILFAALFVLIFVGFAVAQGIGAPSVPAGAVAVVKGAPDDIGTVSEEEFKRALDRQAKGAKAPKPGTEKYEEAKEAALGELLDTIWIQGEAEDLGISVTEKQIETELENIKKQSFPTAKAYKKFLAESGFTQKDVDTRVKVQLLSSKIQEQITNSTPTPSSSEIEEYYEAEKASQFTTPASRDVRVIFNKDKKKVVAAQAELEKDHSPAGWKKAAKKYSADPSTKTKGGLQEGITEEFVQGKLKEAIFDSATGELIGPLENQGNWLLLEVVKLNPAKTKTLGESRSQINQTLTQEKQQEYFSTFVSSYEGKWRSRTHCASGYEIPKCGNYKASGHPANAPPACYEANPKTPATGCPSVVPLTSPALPGTVTRLKPKGEAFPQRPYPEASQEAAPEGLPSGAPTGE